MWSLVMEILGSLVLEIMGSLVVENMGSLIMEIVGYLVMEIMGSLVVEMPRHRSYVVPLGYLTDEEVDTRKMYFFLHNVDFSKYTFAPKYIISWREEVY